MSPKREPRKFEPFECSYFTPEVLDEAYEVAANTDEEDVSEVEIGVGFGGGIVGSPGSAVLRWYSRFDDWMARRMDSSVRISGVVRWERDCSLSALE